MSSVSISLPRSTENFLKAEAKKKGFRSASAYLKALIEDEKRAIEEEYEVIDEKLLEGLRSPASPMTAKDWSDIRNSVRQNIASRTAKKRARAG